MDRDRWRKEVYIGSNKFESDREQYERLKRDIRKGNIQEMSKEQKEQIGIACGDCGRICLSKAGLISHQRSHRTPKSRRTQESEKTNYISNTDKICQECGKICKSAGSLKRHQTVHQNGLQAPAARGVIACNVCTKECKSYAGLKSHFRVAHS